MLRRTEPLSTWGRRRCEGRGRRGVNKRVEANTGRHAPGRPVCEGGPGRAVHGVWLREALRRVPGWSAFASSHRSTFGTVIHIGRSCRAGAARRILARHALPADAAANRRHGTPYSRLLLCLLLSLLLCLAGGGSVSSMALPAEAKCPRAARRLRLAVPARLGCSSPTSPGFGRKCLQRSFCWPVVALGGSSSWARNGPVVAPPATAQQDSGSASLVPVASRQPFFSLLLFSQTL